MTAAAVWMQRLQSQRTRHDGRERFPRTPRTDWVAVIGELKRPIHADGQDGRLEIAFVDEGRTATLSEVAWRPGRAQFSGVLREGDGAGRAFTVEARAAAEGFVIRHRAAKARVLVLTPLSAELHARLPARPPADTSRRIVSPMPGLMVSVDVVVGQEVKAGEAVAVIEAMKMQNIIRAERDGRVLTLGPNASDSVAADELLVEFA